MNNTLFTVQIYTPGSDFAIGFNLSQVIIGRTGNDTLLGFQPISTDFELPQIDLFIGDLSEDPEQRSFGDTYVFGDFLNPYYAEGNPVILGLNDFGFIFDFDDLDTLQLFGSIENYALVDIGVGSALVYVEETPDIVSFILGNSISDLSDNIKFLGMIPAPLFSESIQQLGTQGLELTVATATDTFGHVYIVGGTTGDLEGNNAGLRDIKVAKYSINGDLLQVIQMGSSQFDTVSDIAIDNEGNFFLVGVTEGDLAERLQAVTSDAWIAKFDRAGSLQWIDQFGEGLITQGFSIDVDGLGNAYASGIIVEASEEDIATDNFFVTRYDTNGSQQWFTEIGVPDIPGTAEDFDESYGIAVTEDGTVYATGWTISDLAATVGDLESAPLNAGLYDVWISQLDTDGNLNWLQQFGTEDYEWAWAIDTDSENNAYATGWTLGNLEGTNAGSYDAWIAKYDSEGNQQWLKQFGTSGDDEAFDIFVDGEDNIFVAGYTDSNLGGSNAGSYDAWVARYDTDGNQIWIQQFGTSGFEQAYGISGDNNGNLYLTGVTDSSFGDFNTGSFDGWLAKLAAETGELQSFSGTSESNYSQLNEQVDTSFVSSGLTEASFASLEPETVSYFRDYFEGFVGSLNFSNDSFDLIELIAYNSSLPIFQSEFTLLRLQHSPQGRIQVIQNEALLAQAKVDQNSSAPDISTFTIFAVDSLDSNPRRADFVDRTFFDRGEGIGIVDGDDSNIASRKRIETDEILGVSLGDYEIDKAIFEIDRVSSSHGAEIRVESFKDGALIDSGVFSLGIVPDREIQSLEFSSAGYFDTLHISVANADTSFTFKALELLNSSLG